MSERTPEPQNEMENPMENPEFLSSAAISAHETHNNTNCRLSSEKATVAMVKVVCAEGSNKKSWKLSTYADLKERLRNKRPDDILAELDAVDVLTLGCRSDPVSAKDVDDQVAFSELGYYGGALPISSTFKYDLITVPIQS